MKKVLSIGGVSLFFSLFFIFSLTSFAQTPKYGFTAAEGGGRVVEELAPGSIIERDLEIINYDQERSIEMDLSLKPASSENQVPMPLEWVKMLTNETISVEKANAEAVSIIVAIPEDAADGDYLMMVVSKLIDYEGRETKGSVSMSTAIGVPVKISVSKDFKVVKDLELSEISDVEGGKKKEEEMMGPLGVWIKDNSFFVLLGAGVLLIIILLVKVCSCKKKGRKRKK